MFPAGADITGRIRLDMSYFKKDAETLKRIVKQSADHVAKTYESTPVATQTSRDTYAQDMANDVENAMRRQRDAMEQTQRATEAFDRTTSSRFKNMTRTIGDYSRKSLQSLKQVNNQIEKSRIALLAWSTASTAVAVMGLRSADNLQILNKRYEEIMGSQEEAIRTMAMVERASKRVGVAVRATQRDFAGLIPSIVSAGENIEDYVSLALRLSTLNPQEGMSGAVYAIREALVSGGTDLMSLVERFNIPRAEFRQLFAETGNFSKTLDIMLDRQGATQEMAEMMKNSFGNLFAQIRDSGTQVLEKTFTPALEFARDGLRRLNEMIQNIPIGLVQLAGGIFVVGGALAGLALAFNTAIAGATQLYGVFLALGGIKMVGALGALTAGAYAGRGIARLIGRATGNDRLANIEFSDILETLRKAIFLVGYYLIEGAKGIGKVFAVLYTAFNQVSNGLNIVGSFFMEFGARLMIGASDILKLVEKITFSGHDQSDSIRSGGEDLLSRAFAQRDKAWSEIGDMYSGIANGIDDVAHEITMSWYSLFASASDTADESNKASGALQRLSNMVKTTVDSIRESIANNLLANLEENIRKIQQLEDFETAEHGTIAGRIADLAKEQRAIEKVRDTLAPFVDVSEEAKEAYDRLTVSLRNNGAEILSLQGVLEDALVRDIKALGLDYVDAIDKATDTRQKALDTADAKYKKEIEKQNKSEAKDRDRFNKRIADQEKSAREKEVEQHERYLERIAEINARFQRDAEQSASELSASGIVSAIRRRNEDLAKAEADRNKALLDGKKASEERRAELGLELRDMQEAWAERRQEIENQRDEELELIQQAYAEQSLNALEAYNKERDLLIKTHQDRLRDMLQAQTIEDTFRKQFLHDTYNVVNKWGGLITDRYNEFLHSLQTNVAWNGFMDYVQRAGQSVNDLYNGLISAHDKQAMIGKTSGIFAQTAQGHSTTVNMHLNGLSSPRELAGIVMESLRVSTQRQLSTKGSLQRGEYTTPAVNPSGGSSRGFD